MGEKREVWQGTLALMVLRTLDALGPQHGYGIAKRIEQISEDLLAVNHGTLYPVLLKLEQEGSIACEWGVSDNSRRAKFYRVTEAGRRSSSRNAAIGSRPARSSPGSSPSRERRHETRPSILASASGTS